MQHGEVGGRGDDNEHANGGTLAGTGQEVMYPLK